MLCWDDFFIEKQDNTELRQHKPEKKNVILEGTKVWEGNAMEYASMIKIDGKYRFYYRARGGHFEVLSDGRIAPGNGAQFCIAESTDGKNFKRMPINKIDYRGIKHNNIYFNEERDNFAICYDENPNCPKEEKFKALTMGGRKEEWGHGLYLYVSGDGFDFKRKCKLPIPGSFDSYNIMFWDKETEQYHVYSRGEYRTDGGDIEFDIVQKERSIFRTINHSTSKDFVNFEFHGEINYGNEHYPVQFYTNQIVKYYRANDMFIGMPTRYIDRWENPENFKQMPLPEQHEIRHKFHGRLGTVVTDNVLITSRDGQNFNKWEEAYTTGGIEATDNWFYGDCYAEYGIYETESDTAGAPNELSFIMANKATSEVKKFYRYTTRLDGFISWYAKFNLGKGGEILTKPFTFKGNELEINFASSAMGDMTVTVCDEDGNEIDGYKSIKIFGDSVRRLVKFEKDLADLNDKPIRLKIKLRDCDLYSFKFN